MPTEMSDEYRKAQAELVSSHIAKQDIVITTALIPGRPAPRLISDAQLATMRPGSVVVDLAADAGGNVEGCVAGECGRAPRRDDRRRQQPGAQRGRRFLGAVRAQPLQFPQRLLGQGRGRAGASRRRRDRPGVRLTEGGKVVNDRLDGRLTGRAAATSLSSAAGSPACPPRPHSSKHARVTVLEGEETIGFHSSGRSATMLHYALGNPLVRALTLASRPFFDSPPEGFSDVPLGRRMPVLIHAREDELGELDALDAEIAPFAALERVGEQGMRELCPVLRFGAGGAVAGLVDREGIRLDPHALLQGYARAVRRSWRRARRSAPAPPAIERSGDALEGRHGATAALCRASAGQRRRRLGRRNCELAGVHRSA